MYISSPPESPTRLHAAVVDGELRCHYACVALVLDRIFGITRSVEEIFASLYHPDPDVRAFHLHDSDLIIALHIADPDGEVSDISPHEAAYRTLRETAEYQEVAACWTRRPDTAAIWRAEIERAVADPAVPVADLILEMVQVLPQPAAEAALAWFARRP
jgi:hypothetical protein